MQTSSQQELTSLKENRDRAETQHQVEITALSSNLSALRQQLESGRRKVDSSETKMREMDRQITGTT